MSRLHRPRLQHRDRYPRGCPSLSDAFLCFAEKLFCVMLRVMGSKDKGKKEVKKAPKPKPKPEPGRKREGFTPAPPK